MSCLELLILSANGVSESPSGSVVRFLFTGQLERLRRYLKALLAFCSGRLFKFHFQVYMIPTRSPKQEWEMRLIRLQIYLALFFFYIREGKTYHSQELHTSIYKAIYLFVYLHSLKEGSPWLCKLKESTYSEVPGRHVHFKSHKNNK